MTSRTVLRAVGVYVLDSKDRVLLSQRGAKARHEHGKWESIGGQVEQGETFEQAAKRESLEELGLTISIEAVLYEYEQLPDETGSTWHAVKYLARTDNQPEIKEPEVCVAFGWFTVDEMQELNLATYARQDVETLRQMLKK